MRKNYQPDKTRMPNIVRACADTTPSSTTKRGSLHWTYKHTKLFISSSPTLVWYSREFGCWSGQVSRWWSLPCRGAGAEQGWRGEPGPKPLSFTRSTTTSHMPAVPVCLALPFLHFTCRGSKTNLAAFVLTSPLSLMSIMALFFTSETGCKSLFI